MILIFIIFITIIINSCDIILNKNIESNLQKNNNLEFRKENNILSKSTNISKFDILYKNILINNTNNEDQTLFTNDLDTNDFLPINYQSPIFSNNIYYFYLNPENYYYSEIIDSSNLIAIYISGDFNNFDISNELYKMKKKGNYYYIEISNAIPGQKYKYVIFDNTNFLKFIDDIGNKEWVEDENGGYNSIIPDIESKSNNDNINKIIYISSYDGNDNGFGTKVLPFKTLNRGIEYAQKNNYSIIYVTCGNYEIENEILNSTINIYKSDLKIVGGWNKYYTHLVGYSVINCGNIKSPLFILNNITNFYFENFIFQNINNLNINNTLNIFYLSNVYNSLFTNIFINDFNNINIYLFSLFNANNNKFYLNYCSDFIYEILNSFQINNDCLSNIIYITINNKNKNIFIDTNNTIYLEIKNSNETLISNNYNFKFKNIEINKMQIISRNNNETNNIIDKSFYYYNYDNLIPSILNITSNNLLYIYIPNLEQKINITNVSNNLDLSINIFDESETNIYNFYFFPIKQLKNNILLDFYNNFNLLIKSKNTLNLTITNDILLIINTFNKNNLRYNNWLITLQILSN